MKKMMSMLLILSMITSGCAAITAMNQPPKKNLQVLSAGMSRENVVTQLGAPLTTEENSGEKTEVYQFTQGYSGGLKATKAVIHLTLDALTLFIWEIIAWPVEMLVHGTKMTVKVNYDKDNKVKDVTYLSQK